LNPVVPTKENVISAEEEAVVNSPAKTVSTVLKAAEEE
jgi:hypothetical protein